MTNVAKMLLTPALLLLFIAAACGGDDGGGFTIVVDSTADTDARDDGLTLREAVLVATGELAAADLSSAISDFNYGLQCAQQAQQLFQQLWFL